MCLNMTYKTASLLHTKKHDKMKSLYMDHALGFHGDTHLVKLISQAAILALVILSINTIIRGLTSSYGYINVSKVDELANYNNPIKLEFLPLIFHDLANEGLLKMGDRSLLITNGNEDQAIYNSQVTSDYKMDYLISFSDLTRKKSCPIILEESFDFALIPCPFSKSLNFIDPALKVGGIVVVQLINDNPMTTFLQPSNYKVVYVRKFDSTIIAMKKTTTTYASTKTSTTPAPTTHHRKLFNFAPNAKEAALNKLEDVLLEPPRAASGKSSRYLKRTRYLSELMDIPLESYPRRVFIDVGLQEKSEASGDSSWFSKHYPTRNTKFEIFKIETVNKESSVQLIGMSDWLNKNVKENEYVVMKAEAEVVEEMVRNKAIRLVDELFLECKHQGIKKGDKKKSRRAYWECLSLYGMLRDEGVAVHQWWG
ncbi:PREDICTED: uncharacterized protein LOC109225807 [Nicotiana attenuata]|uniref:DUF7870 domain-containing protein n=1 Tax=Nicotiana attenuata TaxID=49451 RepID=A0A1J6IGL1_NICAT|nr:PREDICTED: uncharacterized protein LOC109225807 [Nicotiana attenuata]OIT03786.1 hypothetical protein A4A49_14317 [Nicotiana attenuata]